LEQTTLLCPVLVLHCDQIVPVAHSLVITADLSCTDLAHHQLESVFSIINISLLSLLVYVCIIIIIIIIVVFIIFNIAGGDYISVGGIHSGRIHFWLYHHAHWGSHGRHRH